MKVIELTGTTDASGDLVITGTKRVTGFIERIDYDYVDADTGADLAIVTTGQAVSAAVLTVTNAGVADVSWFPRSLGNKVADASAYTDSQTKIFLADESIKCTVAQGGNAKDVRLLIYVSNEPQ
jgi:hypothetical protein